MVLVGHPPGGPVPGTGFGHRLPWFGRDDFSPRRALRELLVESRVKMIRRRIAYCESRVVQETARTRGMAIRSL
jgi:hypothetical protein